METAHGWKANPEASFVRLAALIHLIHHLLVKDAVGQIIEQHAPMIVLLQVYGTPFKEAFEWIESRHHGFSRTCMSLRRIDRLERGIRRAEGVLGVEEIPGLPIYEDWNEFLSQNFASLFVESKLKRDEEGDDYPVEGSHTAVA